jgi:hypothetical protein
MNRLYNIRPKKKRRSVKSCKLVVSHGEIRAFGGLHCFRGVRMRGGVMYMSWVEKVYVYPR